MDVNTIIRLLDAGYTREEIQALEGAGDGAAVDNSVRSTNSNELKAPESSEPPVLQFSAASEQPAKTSAASEQPAKTSDESAESLKKVVDDLSEQVKALTKTVQMNNIINSEQPPKPVQTAADILASIINPYTSKGEK